MKDYHVILSLDLPGITDTQRKAFYKHLNDDEFKKTSLTTVWYKKFPGTESVISIRITVRRTIQSAKHISKAPNVDYIFTLSTINPSEGSIPSDI